MLMHDSFSTSYMVVCLKSFTEGAGQKVGGLKHRQAETAAKGKAEMKAAILDRAFKGEL